MFSEPDRIESTLNKSNAGIDATDASCFNELQIVQHNDYNNNMKMNGELSKSRI